MFKTKNTKLKTLPKHIAFIIDGNGRWAAKRGLPRSLGHKAGMVALKHAIENSFELGIPIVTIFGFSTENWNRPKDEVETLFTLFRQFIQKEVPHFMKQEVHLNIFGDYTRFPSDLVASIEDMVKKTATKTKYILNLAINYGGRDEILRAVNLLLQEKKEHIDLQDFGQYLYTKNLPDPDFIIRTSGELRISNFMLWQCAYSEFYFPKTYWPDFDKNELIKSLQEFAKRNRRFGAIKENK